MSDKLGDIHPLDAPDSISNIRQRSAFDKEGHLRERRNVSEDAFSGYEKIADPEAMHILREDHEDVDAEEGPIQENFVSSEIGNRKKGRELWKQEDVILRAKTAIFDEQSNIKKLIDPLFSVFVKQKYGVETKDEAIEKVGEEDLGKSASEYLVANEFLHFLKNNKRWDVVAQIEKRSGTVKKPERREVKAEGNFELKLNRRRIESHLEPEVLKHVERFAAILRTPGVITRILIDTKKDALSAIKLFYDRSDGPAYVFLTPELFHEAFDGVGYYRDHEYSDPTGLTFKTAGGEEINLTPESDEDQITELFSRMTVDGKKVKGNFEVDIKK